MVTVRYVVQSVNKMSGFSKRRLARFKTFSDYTTVVAYNIYDNVVMTNNGSSAMNINKRIERKEFTKIVDSLTEYYVDYYAYDYNNYIYFKVDEKIPNEIVKGAYAVISANYAYVFDTISKSYMRWIFYLDANDSKIYSGNEVLLFDNYDDNLSYEHFHIYGYDITDAIHIVEGIPYWSAFGYMYYARHYGISTTPTNYVSGYYYVPLFTTILAGLEWTDDEEKGYNIYSYISGREPDIHAVIRNSWRYYHYGKMYIEPKVVADKELVGIVIPTQLWDSGTGYYKTSNGRYEGYRIYDYKLAWLKGFNVHSNKIVIELEIEPPVIKGVETNNSTSVKVKWSHDDKYNIGNFKGYKIKIKDVGSGTYSDVLVVNDKNGVRLSNGAGYITDHDVNEGYISIISQSDISATNPLDDTYPDGREVDIIVVAYYEEKNYVDYDLINDVLTPLSTRTVSIPSDYARVKSGVPLQLPYGKLKLEYDSYDNTSGYFTFKASVDIDKWDYEETPLSNISKIVIYMTANSNDYDNKIIEIKPNKFELVKFHPGELYWVTGRVYDNGGLNRRIKFSDINKFGYSYFIPSPTSIAIRTDIPIGPLNGGDVYQFIAPAYSADGELDNRFNYSNIWNTDFTLSNVNAIGTSLLNTTVDGSAKSIPKDIYDPSQNYNLVTSQKTTFAYRYTASNTGEQIRTRINIGVPILSLVENTDGTTSIYIFNRVNGTWIHKTTITMQYTYVTIVQSIHKSNVSGKVMMFYNVYFNYYNGSWNGLKFERVQRISDSFIYSDAQGIDFYFDNMLNVSENDVKISNLKIYRIPYDSIYSVYESLSESEGYSSSRNIQVKVKSVPGYVSRTVNFKPKLEANTNMPYFDLNKYSLVVKTPPPTAALSCPSTVKINTTVNLNASLSSSENVNDTLVYYFSIYKYIGGVEYHVEDINTTNPILEYSFPEVLNGDDYYIVKLYVKTTSGLQSSLVSSNIQTFNVVNNVIEASLMSPPTSINVTRESNGITITRIPDTGFSYIQSTKAGSRVFKIKGRHEPIIFSPYADVFTLSNNERKFYDDVFVNGDIIKIELPGYGEIYGIVTDYTSDLSEEMDDIYDYNMTITEISQEQVQGEW